MHIAGYIKLLVDLTPHTRTNKYLLHYPHCRYISAMYVMYVDAIVASIRECYAKIIFKKWNMRKCEKFATYKRSSGIEVYYRCENLCLYINMHKDYLWVYVPSLHSSPALCPTELTSFLCKVIICRTLTPIGLIRKYQTPKPDVSNKPHLLALQCRPNECHGASYHQPHECLRNRLFRRRSNKTAKFRVTGLCAGNSPVTGEFPAQRASYAESVFIWWRHHGMISFTFWKRLFSSTWGKRKTLLQGH